MWRESQRESLVVPLSAGISLDTDFKYVFDS